MIRELLSNSVEDVFGVISVIAVFQFVLVVLSVDQGTSPLKSGNGQLPASIERNAPSRVEPVIAARYGGVHPLSNDMCPRTSLPDRDAANVTLPPPWSVPPPQPRPPFRTL